MAKNEKKVLVKLNPLFSRNQARDVVTGIMFNQIDAMEIGESDWNRLREKQWYLKGDAYPLLIQVDSESSVEDNEPEDAQWEVDVEDSLEAESVLQDSISEEE
jgi:hypothetical protein